MVKLLGCCLEAKVPLLVYESIPSGIVHEHFHNQGRSLRLSWKKFSNGNRNYWILTYLNSTSSTPIIHRIVKTSNILLDHNLFVKVSDSKSETFVIRFWSSSMLEVFTLLCIIGGGNWIQVCQALIVSIVICNLVFLESLTD